jgi:hypothetical protein
MRDDARSSAQAAKSTGVTRLVTQNGSVILVDWDLLADRRSVGTQSRPLPGDETWIFFTRIGANTDRCRFLSESDRTLDSRGGVQFRSWAECAPPCRWPRSAVGSDESRSDVGNGSESFRNDEYEQSKNPIVNIQLIE